MLRVDLHDTMISDQRYRRHTIKSICAIKLDHIGDFVMAMPAFQALRSEFPSASIDLLCGRWNVLKSAYLRS